MQIETKHWSPSLQKLWQSLPPQKQQELSQKGPDGAKAWLQQHLAREIDIRGTVGAGKMTGRADKLSPPTKTAIQGDAQLQQDLRKQMSQWSMGRAGLVSTGASPKAAAPTPSTKSTNVTTKASVKTPSYAQPPFEELQIKQPVGRGQRNAADDVLAVQKALAHGGYLEPAQVTGRADEALFQAIEQFQTDNKTKKIDGIIDPGKSTNNAINEQLAFDELKGSAALHRPSQIVPSLIGPDQKAFGIASGLDRMAPKLTAGKSSAEWQQAFAQADERMNPTHAGQLDKALLSDKWDDGFMASDKMIEKAVDGMMASRGYDQQPGAKAYRDGAIAHLKDRRHVAKARNLIGDRSGETLKNNELHDYVSSHNFALDIAGTTISQDQLRTISGHMQKADALEAQGQTSQAQQERKLAREALGKALHGEDAVISGAREGFTAIETPSGKRHISDGDLSDFQEVLSKQIHVDKALRIRDGISADGSTLGLRDYSTTELLTDSRANFHGDYKNREQYLLSGSLESWRHYGSIGNSQSLAELRDANKAPGQKFEASDVEAYLHKGRGVLESDANHRASHRHLVTSLRVIEGKVAKEKQQEIAAVVDRVYAETGSKDKAAAAGHQFFQDAVDAEIGEMVDKHYDIRSLPGRELADWSKADLDILKTGTKNYLKAERTRAKAEFFHPSGSIPPQDAKELQQMRKKVLGGGSLSSIEKSKLSATLEFWHKDALQEMNDNVDAALKEAILRDPTNADALKEQFEVVRQSHKEAINAASLFAWTHISQPNAAFNVNDDGHARYKGADQAQQLRDRYNTVLFGDRANPMTAYYAIESGMRSRMADRTLSEFTPGDSFKSTIDAGPSLEHPSWIKTD